MTGIRFLRVLVQLFCHHVCVLNACVYIKFGKTLYKDSTDTRISIERLRTPEFYRYRHFRVVESQFLVIIFSERGGANAQVRATGIWNENH